MPKEKRRSKRSKKQQNKGNVYNEEPEDIDKSSSTSSPLEKERETQNNALNRKQRKLNTSRRSLSSSAQAVEGEGEADNILLQQNQLLNSAWPKMLPESGHKIFIAVVSGKT
ncbi:hypothetical protein BJ742DRAFT_741411 [Cladochytrium replicatum]|nr:hypothetical protein BJ742DRAFT_741411 [Cladochytrium replicatum]